MALAALEGGTRGFAFASGMAAETTLLLTLRPGDHVILADDVYGGTYRLLRTVLSGWGLESTTVDLADGAALPSGVPSHDEARVDRDAVEPDAEDRGPRRRSPPSRIDAGARVVVDNTFATPALQRPLELGADAVVHSVTKYLGGHSDLIGGAIVTSDDEWIERLAFLTNAVGAVPGPMDCFLALRGLKTLAVRMRAHCENARAVAAFLAGHPKVTAVHYPGLASHPGHLVAARQMSDFGGMVSFEVASDRGGARAGHPDRAVLPGGIARRGGIADRGPRSHDARERGGLAAGGARQPGPLVGRDRAPRRPDRRPVPRARLTTDARAPFTHTRATLVACSGERSRCRSSGSRRSLPAASATAAETLEPVATDLSFPSNMAFAPDGRLFFAEKDTGDIRVIRTGGCCQSPWRTSTSCRRASRVCWAWRSTPRSTPRGGSTSTTRIPRPALNRLMRMRGSGDAAERQPLLDALTTEHGYHNGGDIVFGPDGTLFVAVGEVHEAERAQDPDDIGGKILRLNPDGSVPEDNPMGADEPGVLDGTPQLVRSVRRSVDRGPLGDGERAGHRRRGQPDRAGRQLRLAGPARSGGCAVVRRPRARLPRGDRADRLRRVARRPVLRRVRHGPARTGCGSRHRPTRARRWWTTWAQGSRTSRSVPTAISTSRRPTRSGGTRRPGRRSPRRAGTRNLDAADAISVGRLPAARG